jgi:hypothetical protein
MSNPKEATKDVLRPMRAGSSRGELIIPETGRCVDPAEGGGNGPFRSEGLSWRVVACIIGAPFAFAVGLKVHPLAASALAFIVVGLLINELRRCR